MRGLSRDNGRLAIAKENCVQQRDAMCRKSVQVQKLSGSEYLCTRKKMKEAGNHVSLLFIIALLVALPDKERIKKLVSMSTRYVAYPYSTGNVCNSQLMVVL